MGKKIELDYIPFDEMVLCRNRDLQVKKAQSIDRYFPRDSCLSGSLVIHRTSAFDELSEKRSGSNERKAIWDGHLRDGITVAQANEEIQSGNYNNPRIDGDIIIAAYRGAIRLESK